MIERLAINDINDGMNRKCPMRTPAALHSVEAA
jgi:hypothetical protein